MNTENFIKIELFPDFWWLFFNQGVWFVTVRKVYDSQVVST